MGKSSRPHYFNLQTPIQTDPEISLLGGLRSYHIGSISTHMFRGRVRRRNGKAGCEPGQKKWLSTLPQGPWVCLKEKYIGENREARFGQIFLGSEDRLHMEWGD